MLIKEELQFYVSERFDFLNLGLGLELLLTICEHIHLDLEQEFRPKMIYRNPLYPPELLGAPRDDDGPFLIQNADNLLEYVRPGIRRSMTNGYQILLSNSEMRESKNMVHFRRGQIDLGRIR